MPWIELHCKTTADYADALSDQLTLLDAQAVTFQDAGDDPIYEPKPDEIRLWHETIVIGLFDHALSLSPIINYLEEQQAQGIISQFSLKHIADQDWERVCLEHFKPISCGKRLWICPSWQTPPDPQAVNVTLDPGLAFGTGTHPTTKLCLEWLDENIDLEELIIDYGCGSGILALAAFKLGAKQVLAVDNDPQALEATRQNCARNQIGKNQIQTMFPHDILALEPKADVLIANILANPLIELVKTFHQLTKPGAKILLSGILRQQVEQIKITYQPFFELDSIKTQGDWTRLVGIRK